MSRLQPARLLVAIFAALAITLLVNAHGAFAQDDSSAAATADPGAAATADSGTVSASASADADAAAASTDPGAASASTDSGWESGPPIDEDASSAEKVLEIPQAKCDDDGEATNCATSASADNSNNQNDDNDTAINAPSPSAPPADDSTAEAGSPNDDWGNADDYQNQEVAAVPYVVYPYPIGTVAVARSPMQNPSAFASLSSPITSAARPPLNQGPWMTPPTTSAISRPVGAPLMMGRPAPMVMSAPLGMHR